ncbi:MAG TPA: hypothetical protein P5048_04660 [Chlamydiales bacterium]|nr:hypothetical protein [Chlamydiales bacterium]
MRDKLTMESLKKKFSDNFALANYAIQLAKTRIKEGRSENINEIMDDLDNLDPSQIPTNQE